MTTPITPIEFDAKKLGLALGAPEPWAQAVGHGVRVMLLERTARTSPELGRVPIGGLAYQLGIQMSDSGTVYSLHAAGLGTVDTQGIEFIVAGWDEQKALISRRKERAKKRGRVTDSPGKMDAFPGENGPDSRGKADDRPESRSQVGKVIHNKPQVEPQVRPPVQNHEWEVIEGGCGKPTDGHPQKSTSPTTTTGLRGKIQSDTLPAGSQGVATRSETLRADRRASQQGDVQDLSFIVRRGKKLVTWKPNPMQWEALRMAFSRVAVSVGLPEDLRDEIFDEMVSQCVERWAYDASDPEDEAAFDRVPREPDAGRRFKSWMNSVTVQQRAVEAVQARHGGCAGVAGDDRLQGAVQALMEVVK